MGLHPSLTQFNPSCRTCFKHEIIFNEDSNPEEIQSRGLKDNNGAVVIFSIIKIIWNFFSS